MIQQFPHMYLPREMKFAPKENTPLFLFGLFSPSGKPLAKPKPPWVQGDQMWILEFLRELSGPFPQETRHSVSLDNGEWVADGLQNHKRDLSHH